MAPDEWLGEKSYTRITKSVRKFERLIKINFIFENISFKTTSYSKAVAFLTIAMENFEMPAGFNSERDKFENY